MVDVSGVLARYRNEHAANLLAERVVWAEKKFARGVSGMNSRGFPYGFGGMPLEATLKLYGLVRSLRPNIIVETGVCNGASTAAFLAALDSNGHGELYSIDLPEYTGTRYEEGVFWEGKKGAAIPKGEMPGWMVPDRLRSRWRLTLGRSEEELPKLLGRLETIDMFFHDSEHSYQCMAFEYRAAWKHLKPEGLLVSDDVKWNKAFTNFARRNDREIYELSTNIWFIVR